MIISSVIVGALISGLIGALSGLVLALASARFHDRSARLLAHHLKHKENFMALERAVVETSQAAHKILLEQSIYRNNQKIDYIMGQMLTGRLFAHYGINAPLYKDMEKHWPDIFYRIDRHVKDIEPMLNTALNVHISFSEMIKNAEGFNDLVEEYKKYTSGPRGINKGHLPDEMCREAVYDLLLDFPKETWDRSNSVFQNDSLLSKAKEIADEIKSNASTLLGGVENVKNFISGAGTIMGDLEKLELNEKMKGCCEYIGCIPKRHLRTK